MDVIADLHLHGRYSQGTSGNLSIQKLEEWARVKGVSLLGTGDFTHPEWQKEIASKLTDDGSGILKSKSGFPFMCTTEISLIYSQGGKGRRIHNVVLAPNLDAVEQITGWLKTKGRVDYDGRPIFKIPCHEFVESLREIDEKIEVIPAHVWTPWFSLFGSMSGFDSVDEAFGDQTKYIHALETGLSSDPAMNWRLSQLDRYALVSFADAHSFWPWRIGREATLFDVRELSYDSILSALRTQEGLNGTVEVEPSYGKYHWDGHRACNLSLSPKETAKHKGICPVCKKPLTIGVGYRVEELADRPVGFIRKDAPPFHTLLPLSEIIAHRLGTAIATKKVWAVYNSLIERFGNEFSVLLDAPAESLDAVVNPSLASAILTNRAGKVKVIPGYDGVYGRPVFPDDAQGADEGVSGPQERKAERKACIGQKGLGDFI